MQEFQRYWPHVMKELREYPPNYAELARTFPLEGNKPLFAFGNTLYNPHGIEIPEDVWQHEYVHKQQQRDFSISELWWTRYMLDRDFRFTQEAEAFGAQYQFVKRNMPKAAKEALFDFADQLSGPLYQLGITHQEAQEAIRRCGRIME